MTVGTSMRRAAQKLIDDFGNTAYLYTYSSATKTESSEGDITVTNWGSATTIIAVNGNLIANSLMIETQGIEDVGNDEKAIRDNVAIAVNDRLTMNSVEYKVTQVRPVRIQNTLVVQFVSFEVVRSTTVW